MRCTYGPGQPYIYIVFIQIWSAWHTRCPCTMHIRHWETLRFREVIRDVHTALANHTYTMYVCSPGQPLRVAGMPVVDVNCAWILDQNESCLVYCNQTTVPAVARFVSFFFVRVCVCVHFLLHYQDDCLGCKLRSWGIFYECLIIW
jgi:hypothetical protein